MPILPPKLKVLFANRAAGNFAWLIADRGIRLVLGVFVSSWTARYLGPESFGLLAYALSLSATFAAVALLGIDGVAVRDIIWNRAGAGSVIGTSIGLRAAGTLLGALAAVVTVALLRPGDSTAVLLVVIFSAGMVGQSWEFGELLFRADTRMSLLVFPRLGLFLVLNVVKVGLVLQGMPVVWFAVLTALEGLFSGVLTHLLLRRYAGANFRLSFAWSRGVALLKECWPLAVAGASIIVYMRLGQLIIGSVCGDHANGLYSAAIRIPEAANFIPALLGSSLLPGLLAKMNSSEESYDRAVLQYMRISACLAFIICLPLTLASGFVVRLLYSSVYSEAGPVMAVYSWSLLFVFIGFARNQCLLNERKNGLTLVLSLVALGANLALNVILVPLWGIMGAAIATLASQAMAAVVSSWMFAATRKLARLQLIALATPWRVFESVRSAPSDPLPLRGKATI